MVQPDHDMLKSRQFLEANQEIWGVLLDSLGECHSASKKFRFRCLDVILPLLSIEIIQ